MEKEHDFREITPDETGDRPCGPLFVTILRRPDSGHDIDLGSHRHRNRAHQHKRNSRQHTRGLHRSLLCTDSSCSILLLQWEDAASRVCAPVLPGRFPPTFPSSENLFRSDPWRASSNDVYETTVDSAERRTLPGTHAAVTRTEVCAACVA